MGAKGSKVQTVTRDFDVQIKFPDKAGENGEPPAAPRPDRSSDPNIIRITGICQLPPVMVLIRIRLTNGSGCGSGSFYFYHLSSRYQQKTNLKKVFLHITFLTWILGYLLGYL
jgi:hypothetical protein